MRDVTGLVFILYSYGNICVMTMLICARGRYPHPAGTRRIRIGDVVSRPSESFNGQDCRKRKKSSFKILFETGLKKKILFHFFKTVGIFYVITKTIFIDYYEKITLSMTPLII